jgi:hypothetical protein
VKARQDFMMLDVTTRGRFKNLGAFWAWNLAFNAIMGIGLAQSLTAARSKLKDLHVVAAITGMVGTISTVVLAWRTDRRTAKEADLKLVQLQQQIREHELKLISATKPRTRHRVAKTFVKRSVQSAVKT